MHQIHIKTLTNDFYLSKTRINEYDGGFSIVFDTFSEVAMFFRYVGSTGTYYEHISRSINPEGFFSEDDGFQFAADAQVEVRPGAFEVYWAGWEIVR